MFHQTQTARKPPSACTPVTPSPQAATEWCRLPLDDVITACATPYNALSLEMAQQFSVFCP